MFSRLIQIVSGAFLAMRYASETYYAFSSVEHIIRDDVKSGWLIRYMHANGAFFIWVYVATKKTQTCIFF